MTGWVKVWGLNVEGIKEGSCSFCGEERGEGEGEREGGGEVREEIV